MNLVEPPQYAARSRYSEQARSLLAAFFSRRTATNGAIAVCRVYPLDGLEPPEARKASHHAVTRCHLQSPFPRERIFKRRTAGFHANEPVYLIPSKCWHS